jgi:hypothetical protein
MTGEPASARTCSRPSTRISRSILARGAHHRMPRSTKLRAKARKCARPSRAAGPAEALARIAPARAHRPEHRAPDGAADRRLRAERQEVDQPDEAEEQPAHGGGGAPCGRL